ncbi:TPA_asm: hypothetical protein G1H61_24820, partial [Salmonella enterica subsp. enterica]|nr:hypothetical protein [Salmonella enterica subsp. enterica]
IALRFSIRIFKAIIIRINNITKLTLGVILNNRVNVIPAVKHYKNNHKEIYYYTNIPRKKHLSS